MKITVSVINDLVTDQRVHKVCTTLSEAGHEVTLIGRKFRHSKALNRGYKTFRMSLIFNKSFLFYAEYNIRLFFYLLFKKTDIYLSNDTDTLTANYLASNIKRKSLFFDAHEMFPEMPEVINRPFVRNFWMKVEDWIFPKLKYSYTVCQSIADIYNKKYGINMQVVRNIPFANTNKGKSEITTKPIIQENRKVILYQGAVNIGRGIEWIIDAMPYLDGYVFYVVGDGDVLQEMKQRSEDRGVTDRVIFTGRIPFEELSSYTKCADIGVNLLENMGLNYYFSLPNRIFDFIRNNIPVLASDFPEIRRIVAGYETGILIDSYEPEYLAGKIKELSSKHFNQDNFAIANRELTWENESKVLLKLIESVKS